MKFLADMNISPGTARALRQRGYDAIHLREQGLQRLPDPKVLEKARSEERVLLTFDLDFGALLTRGAASVPSVILFRLRNMTESSVTPRLLEVLTKCQAEIAQERSSWLKMQAIVSAVSRFRWATETGPKGAAEGDET